MNDLDNVHLKSASRIPQTGMSQVDSLQLGLADVTFLWYMMSCHLNNVHLSEVYLVKGIPRTRMSHVDERVMEIGQRNVKVLLIMMDHQLD